MNIFPVEQHFRHHGYDYRLERLETRDNRAYAIYRQSAGDTLAVRWEVHVLRLREVRGKLAVLRKYQDFSHYWARPSDEDWGNYGWTFITLPDAVTKLAELVAEDKAREVA